MLLCDALTVKLNGLLVAPEMFVNAPPLLACHCNVGTGVPMTAAVNDTTVPVQALAFTGLTMMIGLLIVSVATLEVTPPQLLKNTARN